MLGRNENEATLRYRDGRFEVIIPGDYVLCAVTLERIPLPELRYWSVERQEPYTDAWRALQALRGR